MRLRRFGSGRARQALELQSRKRIHAIRTTHESDAVRMSVGSRNLQKRVNISNGRDKLRYEGQKLRFKFDLPRLEFRDPLKHVSYIVARSRINASSGRN